MFNEAGTYLTLIAVLILVALGGAIIFVASSTLAFETVNGEIFNTTENTPTSLSQPIVNIISLFNISETTAENNIILNDFVGERDIVTNNVFPSMAILTVHHEPTTEVNHSIFVNSHLVGILHNNDVDSYVFTSAFLINGSNNITYG